MRDNHNEKNEHKKFRTRQDENAHLNVRNVFGDAHYAVQVGLYEIGRISKIHFTSFICHSVTLLIYFMNKMMLYFV
jgi:hypothetical protein